jgi:death-on-curing protein
MRDDPIWLTIEEVLAIHERLLDEHGGLAGVRDHTLLESALARPRHQFAYGDSDLFTLGAAYADGVVNNHPFLDGNKRTGFMCAYVFLGINGLRLNAPEEQAVLMTLGLADKSVAPEKFAEWLKDNSSPRA